VLIVAVDEGPVDIEDRCIGHADLVTRNPPGEPGKCRARRGWSIGRGLPI
jgi:hypothetical protein